MLNIKHAFLFIFNLLLIKSSISRPSRKDYCLNTNDIDNAARTIASSLNGEDFLKELVSLKDGANVEYKIIEDESCSKTEKCKDESLLSTKCVSSICVYTSKLWFYQKNLKFRETISIKDISPDDQNALVECSADYHNGKKWVPCSTTTCGISYRKCIRTNSTSSTPLHSTNNDVRPDYNVHLDVKTNVKIRIPGISSQVEKKINDTFQNAVIAFVGSRHGIPSTSLTLR